MKKSPDNELHTDVVANDGHAFFRVVLASLILVVATGTVSASELPPGYLPPGDSLFLESQRGGHPPNAWPPTSSLPSGGIEPNAHSSWLARPNPLGAARQAQFTDDTLDPALLPQQYLDPPPTPPVYDTEVVNHPYCSCPGGCPSSWAFRAEALYLNRESERSTLSNDFSLGPFGYESGLRATLIRRIDCLEAWEVTYVGPFKFTTQGELSGVSLNSPLVADGINLSAFNGAAFHRQARESQLNSFEVMKKCWGWDILATSIGVRYLNLTDEFSFMSIDPAPGSEVGSLNLDLDNHLVGPQFGLDLLYPHRRWTFASRFKAGLYGNFASGKLRVLNAGALQVDNDPNEGQLSALVELGVTASYQVTPRVALRAGYEFWYVYGVALTTEQVISPLSAATLSSMKTSSDAFFHGASVGLETTW